MKIVLKKLILPEDSPKRIGRMYPKFITIHETSLGTGLEPATKNADYYYDKLLNDGRQIGYHFLVEANESECPVVYQFLATRVFTYHTGNHYGNEHSIGIERLVNVKTDMLRAIVIQAYLTAALVHMYDISYYNVVPHNFWSDKKCPSRLLSGQYSDWRTFMRLVNYYIDEHVTIKGIL